LYNGNMKESNYYIYMIRCEDNSLYTGITTDFTRRLKEHMSGGPKSARYTKNHRPKTIEKIWMSSSRSQASKLEYALKKLSKKQKEELVSGNASLVSLLGENYNDYSIYNL